MIWVSHSFVKSATLPHEAQNNSDDMIPLILADLGALFWNEIKLKVNKFCTDQNHPFSSGESETIYPYQ